MTKAPPVPGPAPPRQARSGKLRAAPACNNGARNRHRVTTLSAPYAAPAGNTPLAKAIIGSLRKRSQDPNPSPPMLRSGRGQRGRRVVLPERPRPECLNWADRLVTAFNRGEGIGEGRSQVLPAPLQNRELDDQDKSKGRSSTVSNSSVALKRHSAQICELCEASSSASSFLINISLTIYIPN